MKKSFVLLAAFLLCSSATLVAQDASSIIGHLEKVTKEKEPDWKLDRKPPADQLVVLRWSSGEQRILLSIFLTGSAEGAKKIYTDYLQKMSVEAGPDVKRSAVLNLGEENQLWSSDQGRSARLLLRHGQNQVLMFAPTDDLAKRFGRHVVDALAPATAVTAQADSAKWKEYSHAEGRFSIMFPGPPVDETQVVEVAPGVELKLRIYKHKSVAECSVMFADYPMPVDDPAVAKSVLDAGARGAAASINAEMLELKEISHDGYPGRYMKERLTSKEIMRAKMILVGQRLYQLAITTPAEDGLSADLIKAYEAMADKFLNSFKVAKKEDKKLTAQSRFLIPTGMTNSATFRTSFMRIGRGASIYCYHTLHAAVAEKSILIKGDFA